MVQSQNLETGLLNGPHYLMGPDCTWFSLKIWDWTEYFGTMGLWDCTTILGVMLYHNANAILLITTYHYLYIIIILLLLFLLWKGLLNICIICTPLLYEFADI